MSLRERYRALPGPLRMAILDGLALGFALLAYAVAPFKLLRHLLLPEGSRRLHLGCGGVRLSGWINADLDPRADLIVDARLPLPFSAGSLERIYSEHLVEHLSAAAAARFFRRAHRALAPGGVMRIAMPDLDDLVDGYQRDWRRFEWLHRPGHEFIQTRAEMINMAFRAWGHRYLYNREELERRLREAGFSKVTFCGHGLSELSDLRGLETRPDSKLVAEAVK